jgi:hypothetical protein
MQAVAYSGVETCRAVCAHFTCDDCVLYRYLSLHFFCDAAQDWRRVAQCVRMAVMTVYIGTVLCVGHVMNHLASVSPAFVTRELIQL